MLKYLLFFCLSSFSVFATPQEWENYLDDFKERLCEKGIKDSTLDDMFKSIDYLETSVHKDKNQAEFTQTFNEYYTKHVDKTRIENGKKMWKKHHDIFQKTEEKYGVPARYLVAFWGLETNYGKIKGTTPLLSSLATLAFEGRRRSFFEKQFEALVRGIEEEKLDNDALIGSWAGAFGHFQFIPTTYAAYGVDGNEDGKIDLVNDLEDAISSAANYLSSIGWDTATTWGRPVLVPENFNWKAVSEKYHPLDTWAQKGIRTLSGEQLPKRNLPARLIAPSGQKGPAFLVYPNFKKIMNWNNATFYALNIGLLSDAFERKEFSIKD